MTDLFAFLQAEWPAVHAYKSDASLRLPYQDNLSALIHEPSFKAAVGEALFSKARLINQLGNQAKARAFLRAHEDHVAIHKLRMNRTLTASDLAELERMLAESGVGDARNIERARSESQGLGVFVRLLVGLDREAAEGEAAGAASSPHQKISYIVGKWQIMNLLGRYKDRQGENFRLGQFHDDLIKNGSLPVSVIDWLLLDDPTGLQTAMK